MLAYLTDNIKKPAKTPDYLLSKFTQSSESRLLA